MPGGFLPEWVGAGIALLVLFAFSYIQIRHAALAAASALAPLPGYFLAMALHVPSQPLCYLCGFIVAGVFLSAVEMQVCDGASPANATSQAIRSIGGAVIWLLVLAITMVAVLSAMSDLALLTLSLLVPLSGASAFGFAFLAARYLPYDDEFVVSANRLRERRERWLDSLAFVVQPRWGWSISGITMIFAVIGYFGGRNSGAEWPLPAVVLIAEVFSVAVVSYAAIRNLRRVSAFVAVVAVLALLASWIGGRLPWTASDMVLATAVAAMPPFVIAIQAARFEREKDTAAVASLRASEHVAIPIAFFCSSSAVALFVVGTFADAILVFAGGVAALIVFPAVSTAIHDLFPPRISPDAYRIR